MKPPATPGRRRSAGFTLVELAVVAVLASLLAAIAVPVWSGHLMRARRAEILTDPGFVDQVLAAGALRAREEAGKVLSRVRSAVGLV